MKGQKGIWGRLDELRVESGEWRVESLKSGKSFSSGVSGFRQLRVKFFYVAFLLLVSCASKQQGLGYFEGSKQQTLPDSAKVKAVVSVSQGETKEKLSAVLFAIPNEKYRLELSGTFGLSAASILWKKDGWRIVLPQNERYIEGVGDCVFVPIYGGVDIHKFAALFLGQKTNSLDCNVSNPQNLTLEYNGNVASITTPLVETDNYPSLQLEIKNIDPKAEWKSGVWNLNVPESYVRITDY